MKAVYHQQYRKRGTGNLMFVYVITGTTKEIEEYATIQEDTTGRAAGTWPKADNGAPLWWLNVDIEKRNGNMPKQSYTLIFNRDKTRIIRDDSGEQMASFDRVNKLKEAKLAEFQAQIELGLIEVPTRTGAARVTTTTAGTKLEGLEDEGATKEPKSLADEIVAGIGNNDATGEDLGE